MDGLRVNFTHFRLMMWVLPFYRSVNFLVKSISDMGRNTGEIAKRDSVRQVTNNDKLQPYLNCAKINKVVCF